MRRFLLLTGIILGLSLVTAAWLQKTSFSVLEAVGFVTGAACVYLVIKENIWNFPIGIANNIFFLVLFAQARIFGDAGLQVVYVILGFHGWYQWLRGGENRTQLKLSRATMQLIVLTVLLVTCGTIGLMLILKKANGIAPLLDSFTTILSLAAQVLLNRKVLENWLCWMLADVVYLFLYISRGLHLTAILYGIFLCMCVAGYLNWRRLMSEELEQRSLPSTQEVLVRG